MSPRLRRAIACCGLLAAAGPAWAQRYVLRVLPAPGTDHAAFAAALHERPTRFRSEKSLARAMQALLPDLQAQGLLGASCDTLFRVGDTLTAVIQLNLRYHWASFSLDAVDAAVLRAARVRPTDWATRPLERAEVVTLSRRLLRGARQRHPGVAVWHLEGVNLLADGGVSGRIWLLPGPR